MKNQKCNTNGKFSDSSKTPKGAKNQRRKKQTSVVDTSPRSSKFGTEPVEQKKYNDVSWYAKNQQMLNDAASYSYNNPLGTKLGLDRILTPFHTPSAVSSIELLSYASSVPGLMNLQIGICPGISRDSTSPINIAAQNIYSYVRYMNSGAKNYDPTDLMMYMFAMDSAYACWNFYKRLYGIVTLYSQQNWYLPKALVQAAGVNFDDLLANIADFRLYLNSTAAKLTSFCVPAVMPLFVRHSWLFANVYKDSENEKAQLYQFSPKYFYRYDEVADTKGGKLTAVAFKVTDATPHTFQSLKSYLNELLDHIQYSEDIGVMSGDILKAYGNDKLFKITPVEPDYTVQPVYNEEVLNQIHNATVLGGVSILPEGEFDITQDPNTNNILWDPSFAPTPVNRDGALINMPWENVTPANTMVGTRLTAGVYFDASINKSRFRCVGSDFVYAAQIYFMDLVDNPKGIASMPITSIAMLGKEDAATWGDVKLAVISMAARCTMLSNFDWHPLMYVLVGTETTKNHFVWSTAGVLGDISKYTIIVDDDLEKLHQTAIMSEFNIPQLGSF